MQHIDYIVLSLYLLGVLGVGIALAARNKNAAEMFAAGGQSPWWVSGVSSFMTMFSAGTFVVWGGIAYKFGMVAVAINLCYGVAALLVGWTVAGRWKESGIQTPAQYVELRFGKSALQFYTWAIMAFKLISTAVALYSLCVLLVAMMPLSEGSPLRDPVTGNLSLTSTIVILGSVVVLYTMIGGLWGVLMTDVLQFIVLNLSVLFVVPLALSDIGGVGQFIAKAPDGFLSPTGGGYTWFFLFGWVVIHYFVVGAEWAYVQRYFCVPTPTDARKAAYLFGLLYLFSPGLWLLPPMIQRIRFPLPSGASDELTQSLAESAYIDVCQAVLPPGMVGLLIAAMFSATASMVSSQLNVFAGVLTNDILKPWLRNPNDQRLLVWVGRGFTVLLGAAIIAVALAVPSMGGAEDMIVPATSLMIGTLLAPLLVGILSKREPTSAVWLTVAACCGAILIVKFVLPLEMFADSPLGPLVAWSQDNVKTVNILLGAVLPMIVVGLSLAYSRETSPGWVRLAELETTERGEIPPAASKAPALIVGWSLLACSTLMAGLCILAVDGRSVLAVFALVLFVLALAVFVLAGKLQQIGVQGLKNAEV